MHLTIKKLSDGCSVRDLVVRRARCCMPHCRSGRLRGACIQAASLLNGHCLDYALCS